MFGVANDADKHINRPMGYVRQSVVTITGLAHGMEALHAHMREILSLVLVVSEYPEQQAFITKYYIIFADRRVDQVLFIEPDFHEVLAQGEAEMNLILEICWSQSLSCQIVAAGEYWYSDSIHPHSCTCVGSYKDLFTIEFC